jgi:hypothetical protein
MTKQTKSKELELAIILARLAKHTIESSLECPGLRPLLISQQWKEATPHHKVVLLDHQYHRDYQLASERTRQLMIQTRMEIESALSI